MFNWYREWLQIRYESRVKNMSLKNESKVCESCEILKHQLEVVYYEKKQLLDRLLERPPIEQPKELNEVVRPQRNIPWNIKKQMLETEDREKAKLLREAPKPISTEELEKELDIVSKEREAAKE